MKSNTHPEWYPQAKVTCVCGNSFTVGSAVPEISVEICSACHPFFTGETKYVDTLGRVEKFQKKQQAAAVQLAKKKKKADVRKQKEEGPRTLKEMLSKKS